MRPAETPEDRKHNTSKAAAQLLADFKEILGDCAPLRCLSPVTAKVTRVTVTALLLMLLDFPLFKAVWCPVVHPSPPDHKHVQPTEAWIHKHVTHLFFLCTWINVQRWECFRKETCTVFNTSCLPPLVCYCPVRSQLRC